MQFTAFAHLHGAKYHFFILENIVIAILEATELMPFREMFLFCSFNHMKHQINCVGAQDALGPAVSCEKPSSIFFQCHVRALIQLQHNLSSSRN